MTLQNLEFTRAMYQAAIEQKNRMRKVESTVMITELATDAMKG